jgi:dynactin complex subunit
MVLFDNINVKARVEVLWRGDIYDGTVRYTGVLVARPGDWIGVELDRAGIANSLVSQATRS